MEENLNQNVSLEPSGETPLAPSVSKPPLGSWWKVGFLVVGVLLVITSLLYTGIYYFVLPKQGQKPYSKEYKAPFVSEVSPISVPTAERKPVLAPLKSGLPFDVIVKAVKAQVLGEQTGPKKNIPVQIYAYEDHNGNGVREPDDEALFLMPVEIYDSPFAEAPIQKLNSTGTGWASALLAVGPPYQLIVNPVPTKEYFPTTKPIIVSERNNFAVVGYQKIQSVSFHISVFAFEDANKDSNFNYDDKNEKPLFLAPFKFYQQKEDGSWELLPNSMNSTGTGWGTTTLEVLYPYKVKIEAGDLNNLTPSNKELVISNRNTTVIFPYISQ